MVVARLARVENLREKSKDMSIIKKSLSASIVCVLGATLVAGCSASVSEGEGVDEVNEAICSGNSFYGSDTMKPAIVGPASAAGITYLGTGSGVGESGLRGAGTCGPNAQLSAPMSRDINGSCNSGGIGSHTDTLKTKAVARDGVLILTALDDPSTGTVEPTNPAVHATACELANAFCTNNGNCQNAVSVNGQTITTRYRRDASSGTSDTLQQLLNTYTGGGCTALCADTDVGSPSVLGTSKIQTIVDGSLPSVCTSGAGLTAGANASASKCIGFLSATNQGATAPNYVLGYSGLSALTITRQPKKLDVSGSASDTTCSSPTYVAATSANIVNGSYPLSRYLFVNYNNTELTRASKAFATTQEVNFLCKNVLTSTTPGCTTVSGAGTLRASFESGLVTNGDFVACDDTAATTPLDCNPATKACP